MGDTFFKPPPKIPNRGTTCLDHHHFFHMNLPPSHWDKMTCIKKAKLTKTFTRIYTAAMENYKADTKTLIRSMVLYLTHKTRS